MGARHALLWLGLSWLLAACARPPAPATLVPTATYTATEAAFAANRNPLTGLPSSDPAIATYRPDAFAVGTEPGQDLPAGAQTADLVVEVLDPATPGFTLVTQERAGRRPTLGPLGRLTPRDLAVASMLSAALTAAEAPPDLVEQARATQVSLTVVGAGVAGPAPARAGRPLAPRWTFAETPASQATALGTLGLAQPGAAPVEWRYDPILGTWRRWVGGRAAMDPQTGEPLTAVNVVVMAVPGRPGSPGWWTGTGGALLLRDGTQLPGRWSRADAASPLGLLDERGMAMALRPGNTWWGIVADWPAAQATPPVDP